MRKYSIALVALLLFLTGTRIHAQIYIVFDGVEGESRFAGFKNSTELNSFSFGAESSTSISIGSGGAGAGKVSFSDISITKSRGPASSALQNKLFSGGQIAKAEIRYYKAGQPDPYFVVYLENVFISSFKLDIDKTGTPVESVSLKYVKIKTEDWIRSADGSIRKLTSGWDVSVNRAF